MAELKETYKLCVITHKKTRSIWGYAKIRNGTEFVDPGLLSVDYIPSQIFSNVVRNVNFYYYDPFENTDFEVEEIYREEITVELPI